MLRLGIVPVLARPNGGIVQYSLTMLNALRFVNKAHTGEGVVVFASDANDLDPSLRTQPHWTVMPPEPPGLTSAIRPLLRRVARGGLGLKAWARLKTRMVEYPFDVGAIPSSPKLARWYRSTNVGLMLYPCHTERAFEVGIPYVMAIHDVAHRLQPEFPEITGGFLWEWAEHTYRNGVRHATLVLADSDVGREDILEIYGRYGLEEDQVKVLPFVPPPYLRTGVSIDERQHVRAKYGLPERYLFYPSDISRHKNQAQIIRALHALKEERGLDIPIVLCGGRGGSSREEYFTEIRRFVQRKRMEASVHYLDYVPHEDMSALYANAVALVMPTFVGPTTIPVCEAWACGCPVMTSDIRGLREQAGDAAILIDPRSVDSIADAILRLWTDETLRHTLVCRGKQRVAAYTFDDFCCRLDSILTDATARLRPSTRVAVDRV